MTDVCLAYACWRGLVSGRAWARLPLPMEEGRMTDDPTRPLVSVLIPAYRAGDLLARTVAVLLADGVPAEILIESDDGGGYEALAALSPAVKVGRTGAVQSGVGAARNRALARARGDWVVYVDADDEVAPGFLPALLAAAAGPGGAVAQTEVREGGRLLGVLGVPGAGFTLADLGREGASWRGLFRREGYPAFENDLSQDVLHMAEVLLARGGPVPVAAARYVLNVTAGSVTGAEDFAARVEAAYLRHIERLRARYPGAAGLAAAEAMVRRKIALNRAFMAEDGGQSYYGWALAGGAAALP